MESVACKKAKRKFIAEIEKSDVKNYTMDGQQVHGQEIAWRH